jgi:hypothetical protein
MNRQPGTPGGGRAQLPNAATRRVTPWTGPDRVPRIRPMRYNRSPCSRPG